MKNHALKKHIQAGSRPVRYALLSLLGLVVPFALGLYHRDVAGGEAYHQFYTFPKAGARPVILRYGNDGILHRLISRNTVGGTLGLTNTGEAAKIRMQMVGVPDDLSVHWENGHTRDFNLTTKTIDRILNPGDAVSVHHTFSIGRDLRRKDVIFDGGLRITDVDSGTQLLFIPIRILKGGGSAPERRESGGHVH